MVSHSCRGSHPHSHPSDSINICSLSLKGRSWANGMKHWFLNLFFLNLPITHRQTYFHHSHGSLGIGIYDRARVRQQDDTWAHLVSSHWTETASRCRGKVTQVVDHNPKNTRVSKHMPVILRESRPKKESRKTQYEASSILTQMAATLK